MLVCSWRVGLNLVARRTITWSGWLHRHVTFCYPDDGEISCADESFIDLNYELNLVPTGRHVSDVMSYHVGDLHGRWLNANQLVIMTSPWSSDVCLEAEASPRCSLEAAKALPWPRLDVLMPRLGLASVWMLSPLSYVTISSFITFIHPSFVHMCLRPFRQNFIYMYKTPFLYAS